LAAKDRRASGLEKEQDITFRLREQAEVIMLYSVLIPTGCALS
jgi:hypothetical protein